MGRAQRSATRRTRSVSVELPNARGREARARRRGRAASVELRLLDEDLRCRAPVSAVAVDGIGHHRRHQEEEASKPSYGGGTQVTPPSQDVATNVEMQ